MVEQKIRKGYKQTELGVIPDDWSIVTINNICLIRSGKRIPKGNSLSNTQTKHPYIRIKDLKNNGVLLDDLKYVPDHLYSKIKKYIITKDDIYISVAGTLGLVGKIPEQLDGANLTENANRLTQIKCDRDYLLIFLTSQKIQTIIESVKTIGAQPKLAIYQIKKIKILLPPTNGEQKIIAKNISDIVQLINSIESLIQKKKNIKQGAMQELLTGKRRLEGFSGEWQEVQFDSLCKSFTKQTGFDYTAHIKPKLVTTSHIDVIPFIQNKDFNAKKINFDTDYYLPVNVAENYPNILLDEKCLLISISGSIGNVGIFSNLKKAFVGGAIGVAKFKNKNNLEWVLYYLLSNEGKKIFFKDTKSGAHHNLTVEGIRNMMIPIPPPDEKSLITEILSKMDSEIEQLESQKEKYINLKQAMMQKLLTGEIRLV